MGNPFESKNKEWEEITESELECQKCCEIVTEGKYFPELQILSWRCPKCNHISKVNMKL